MCLKMVTEVSAHWLLEVGVQFEGFQKFQNSLIAKLVLKLY